MTHREKVTAALADLKRRGVDKRFHATPIHRLLWLFNIPVAPPLFQRFIPLALLTGIGVALPGMVVIIVFPLQGQKAEEVLHRLKSFGPVFLLLCFSIAALIAAGTRWYAQTLDLPPWEEFEPPSDDSSGAW